MKQKFFLSAALLSLSLLFSCGGENNADGNDSTSASADSTEIQAAELKLSELNEKAPEYVDKEVKITGIVDHVCKHGGKRLLLVSDDNDIHVDAEVRFDDNLAGSEIVVHGILREERVDEAYLTQWKEDAINKHSEAEDAEERLAMVEEKIKFYRDSMEQAGVKHLSFYNLEYLSHEVKQ